MSFSSATANYALRLWSASGDQFDNADYNYNLTQIDTILAQPRPASSAAAGAALPGTPANGDLFYLTAPIAGTFAANTLLQYIGTAWHPVGQPELSASVPTANLYGGRTVLLTGASAPFAAWTLIVYNGTTTSWQQVGRGIDVIDPVATPLAGLTGNYAGRVLVITNSATEPTNGTTFVAYDILRWNGTIYELVGPQKNPTVSTTITGLGTAASGKQGLIRAGSTPYSFLPVIYDATYTHWIGETDTLASQLGPVATTSTSMTQLTQSELPTPYMPWAVYDTAGLKPQFRLISELVTDNVGGTATAALGFRGVNVSGTPGAFTTSATTIAVTGNTNQLKDTGWIDIPALTVTDYLDMTVQIQSSSGSVSATVAHATIRFRWVSKP